MMPMFPAFGERAQSLLRGIWQAAAEQVEMWLSARKARGHAVSNNYVVDCFQLSVWNTMNLCTTVAANRRKRATRY